MKVIVNLILTLLPIFTIHSQNIAPNEFIVSYIETITEDDMSSVRALYNIDQYTRLSEGIELWQNISFPITVQEGGVTTTINDVISLQEYIISVQQNGNDTQTTANINNGDPNLRLFLDNNGALYDDGNFDPLPLCDDIYNNQLIGIDQSTVTNQNSIKIIIADQLIPDIPSSSIIDNPEILGGTHGIKVHSVINNILTQAGITNVEYINLVLFDNNGRSTSALLVKLGQYILEQLESGNWSPSDKIIINFSANLITGNSQIAGSAVNLKELWGRLLGSTVGNSPYIPYDNVLLVSAAGNQNIESQRNVFPGEVAFAAEITVAGTEQCFERAWTNTNSSSTYYEIATESENILTNDGDNFFLSNGTSFAAPQITSAIVQLALDNPELSLLEVKDLVLQYADSVPALMSTVQNGKVLNIGNYFGINGNSNNHGGEYGEKTLNNKPSSSPLSLQTTPNPFSQNARISIGVPVGEDAEVSLYNSIGQMVHQERIPNQQELKELEWITPNHLPKGTYFVRVQAGDQQAQQMIVKQ